MGNWKISITGHGIHHNGRQDDAETMAAVFIGELLAAGHEVSAAEFILTGEFTDLKAVAPPVSGTSISSTYDENEALADGRGGRPIWLSPT